MADRFRESSSSADSDSFLDDDEDDSDESLQGDQLEDVFHTRELLQMFASKEFHDHVARIVSRTRDFRPPRTRRTVGAREEAQVKIASDRLESMFVNEGQGCQHLFLEVLRLVRARAEAADSARARKVSRRLARAARLRGMDLDFPAEPVGVLRHRFAGEDSVVLDRPRGRLQAQAQAPGEPDGLLAGRGRLSRELGLGPGGEPSPARGRPLSGPDLAVRGDLLRAATAHVLFDVFAYSPAEIASALRDRGGLALNQKPLGLPASVLLTRVRDYAALRAALSGPRMAELAALTELGPAGAPSAEAARMLDAATLEDLQRDGECGQPLPFYNLLGALADALGEPADARLFAALSERYAGQSLAAMREARNALAAFSELAQKTLSASRSVIAPLPGGFGGQFGGQAVGQSSGQPSGQPADPFSGGFSDAFPALGHGTAAAGGEGEGAPADPVSVPASVSPSSPQGPSTEQRLLSLQEELDLHSRRIREALAVLDADPAPPGVAGAVGAAGAAEAANAAVDWGESGALGPLEALGDPEGMGGMGGMGPMDPMGGMDGIDAMGGQIGQIGQSGVNELDGAGAQGLGAPGSFGSPGAPAESGAPGQPASPSLAPPTGPLAGAVMGEEACARHLYLPAHAREICAAIDATMRLAEEVIPRSVEESHSVSLESYRAQRSRAVASLEGLTRDLAAESRGVLDGLRAACFVWEAVGRLAGGEDTASVAQRPGPFWEAVRTLVEAWVDNRAGESLPVGPEGEGKAGGESGDAAAGGAPAQAASGASADAGAAGSAPAPAAASPPPAPHAAVYREASALLNRHPGDPLGQAAQAPRPNAQGTAALQADARASAEALLLFNLEQSLLAYLAAQCQRLSRLQPLESETRAQVSTRAGADLLAIASATRNERERDRLAEHLAALPRALDDAEAAQLAQRLFDETVTNYWDLERVYPRGASPESKAGLQATLLAMELDRSYLAGVPFSSFKLRELEAADALTKNYCLETRSLRDRDASTLTPFVCDQAEEFDALTRVPQLPPSVVAHLTDIRVIQAGASQRDRAGNPTSYRPDARYKAQPLDPTGSLLLDLELGLQLTRLEYAGLMQRLQVRPAQLNTRDWAWTANLASPDLLQCAVDHFSCETQRAVLQMVFQLASALLSDRFFFDRMSDPQDRLNPAAYSRDAWDAWEALQRLGEVERRAEAADRRAGLPAPPPGLRELQDALSIDRVSARPSRTRAPAGPPARPAPESTPFLVTLRTVQSLTLQLHQLRATICNQNFIQAVLAELEFQIRYETKLLQELDDKEYNEAVAAGASPAALSFMPRRTLPPYPELGRVDVGGRTTVEAARYFLSSYIMTRTVTDLFSDFERRGYLVPQSSYGSRLATCDRELQRMIGLLAQGLPARDSAGGEYSPRSEPDLAGVASCVCRAAAELCAASPRLLVRLTRELLEEGTISVSLPAGGGEAARPEKSGLAEALAGKVPGDAVESEDAQLYNVGAETPLQYVLCPEDPYSPLALLHRKPIRLLTQQHAQGANRAQFLQLQALNATFRSGFDGTVVLAPSGAPGARLSGAPGVVGAPGGPGGPGAPQGAAAQREEIVPDVVLRFADDASLLRAVLCEDSIDAQARALVQVYDRASGGPAPQDAQPADGPRARPLVELLYAGQELRDRAAAEQTFAQAIQPMETAFRLWAAPLRALARTVASRAAARATRCCLAVLRAHALRGAQAEVYATLNHRINHPPFNPLVLERRVQADAGPEATYAPRELPPPTDIFYPFLADAAQQADRAVVRASRNFRIMVAVPGGTFSVEGRAGARAEYNSTAFVVLDSLGRYITHLELESYGARLPNPGTCRDPIRFDPFVFRDLVPSETLEERPVLTVRDAFEAVLSSTDPEGFRRGRDRDRDRDGYFADAGAPEDEFGESQRRTVPRSAMDTLLRFYFGASGSRPDALQRLMEEAILQDFILSTGVCAVAVAMYGFPAARLAQNLEVTLRYLNLPMPDYYANGRVDKAARDNLRVPSSCRRCLDGNPLLINDLFFHRVALASNLSSVLLLRVPTDVVAPLLERQDLMRADPSFMMHSAPAHGETARGYLRTHGLNAYTMLEDMCGGVLSELQRGPGPEAGLSGLQCVVSGSGGSATQPLLGRARDRAAATAQAASPAVRAWEDVRGVRPGHLSYYRHVSRGGLWGTQLEPCDAPGGRRRGGAAAEVVEAASAGADGQEAERPSGSPAGRGQDQPGPQGPGGEGSPDAPQGQPPAPLAWKICSYPMLGRRRAPRPLGPSLAAFLRGRALEQADDPQGLGLDSELVSRLAAAEGPGPAAEDPEEPRPGFAGPQVGLNPALSQVTSAGQSRLDQAGAAAGRQQPRHICFGIWAGRFLLDPLAVFCCLAKGGTRPDAVLRAPLIGLLPWLSRLPGARSSRASRLLALRDPSLGSTRALFAPLCGFTLRLSVARRNLDLNLPFASLHYTYMLPLVPGLSARKALRIFRRVPQDGAGAGAVLSPALFLRYLEGLEAEEAAREAASALRERALAGPGQAGQGGQAGQTGHAGHAGQSGSRAARAAAAAAGASTATAAAGAAAAENQSPGASPASPAPPAPAAPPAPSQALVERGLRVLEWWGPELAPANNWLPLADALSASFLSGPAPGLAAQISGSSASAGPAEQAGDPAAQDAAGGAQGGQGVVYGVPYARGPLARLPGVVSALRDCEVRIRLLGSSSQTLYGNPIDGFERPSVTRELLEQRNQVTALAALNALLERYEAGEDPEAGAPASLPIPGGAAGGGAGEGLPPEFLAALRPGLAAFTALAAPAPGHYATAELSPAALSVVSRSLASLRVTREAKPTHARAFRGKEMLFGIILEQYLVEELLCVLVLRALALFQSETLLGVPRVLPEDPGVTLRAVENQQAEMLLNTPFPFPLPPPALDVPVPSADDQQRLRDFYECAREGVTLFDVYHDLGVFPAVRAPRAQPVAAPRRGGVDRNVPERLRRVSPSAAYASYLLLFNVLSVLIGRDRVPLGRLLQETPVAPALLRSVYNHALARFDSISACTTMSPETLLYYPGEAYTDPYVVGEARIVACFAADKLEGLTHGNLSLTAFSLKGLARNEIIRVVAEGQVSQLYCLHLMEIKYVKAEEAGEGEGAAEAGPGRAGGRGSRKGRGRGRGARDASSQEGSQEGSPEGSHDGSRDGSRDGSPEGSDESDGEGERGGKPAGRAEPKTEAKTEAKAESQPGNSFEGGLQDATDSGARSNTHSGAGGSSTASRAASAATAGSGSFHSIDPADPPGGAPGGEFHDFDGFGGFGGYDDFDGAEGGPGGSGSGEGARGSGDDFGLFEDRPSDPFGDQSGGQPGSQSGGQPGSQFADHFGGQFDDRFVDRFDEPPPAEPGEGNNLFEDAPTPGAAPEAPADGPGRFGEPQAVTPAQAETPTLYDGAANTRGSPLFEPEDFDAFSVMDLLPVAHTERALAAYAISYLVERGRSQAALGLPRFQGAEFEGAGFGAEPGPFSSGPGAPGATGGALRRQAGHAWEALSARASALIWGCYAGLAPRGLPANLEGLERGFRAAAEDSLAEAARAWLELRRLVVPVGRRSISRRALEEAVLRAAFGGSPPPGMAAPDQALAGLGRISALAASLRLAASGAGLLAAKLSRLAGIAEELDARSRAGLVDEEMARALHFGALAGSAAALRALGEGQSYAAAHHAGPGTRALCPDPARQAAFANTRFKALVRDRGSLGDAAAVEQATGELATALCCLGEEDEALAADPGFREVLAAAAAPGGPAAPRLRAIVSDVARCLEAYSYGLLSTGGLSLARSAFSSEPGARAPCFARYDDGTLFLSLAREGNPRVFSQGRAFNLMVTPGQDLQRRAFSDYVQRYTQAALEAQGEQVDRTVAALHHEAVAVANYPGTYRADITNYHALEGTVPCATLPLGVDTEGPFPGYLEGINLRSYTLALRTYVSGPCEPDMLVLQAEEDPEADEYQERPAGMRRVQAVHATQQLPQFHGNQVRTALLAQVLAALQSTRGAGGPGLGVTPAAAGIAFQRRGASGDPDGIQDGVGHFDRVFSDAVGLVPVLARALREGREGEHLAGPWQQPRAPRAEDFFADLLRPGLPSAATAQRFLDEALEAQSVSLAQAAAACAPAVTDAQVRMAIFLVRSGWRGATAASLERLSRSARAGEALGDDEAWVAQEVSGFLAARAAGGFSSESEAAAALARNVSLCMALIQPLYRLCAWASASPAVFFGWLRFLTSGAYSGFLQGTTHLGGAAAFRRDISSPYFKNLPPRQMELHLMQLADGKEGGAAREAPFLFGPCAGDYNSIMLYLYLPYDDDEGSRLFALRVREDPGRKPVSNGLKRPAALSSRLLVDQLFFLPETVVVKVFQPRETGQAPAAKEYRKASFRRAYEGLPDLIEGFVEPLRDKLLALGRSARFVRGEGNRQDLARSELAALGQQADYRLYLRRSKTLGFVFLNRPRQGRGLKNDKVYVSAAGFIYNRGKHFYFVPEQSLDGLVLWCNTYMTSIGK